MQIPHNILWSPIITGRTNLDAMKLGMFVESYEEKEFYIIKLSAWVLPKDTLTLRNANLYLNGEFVKTISINIESSEGYWDEPNTTLIYYTELKINKGFKETSHIFTFELKDIKGYYESALQVSSSSYKISSLLLNQIDYYVNNECIYSQNKYYGYDIIPFSIYIVDEYDKDDESIDTKHFTGWNCKPAGGGATKFNIDKITNAEMSEIGDTPIIRLDATFGYKLSFYTETGLIETRVWSKDKSLPINDYPTNIAEYQNYVYNGWSNKGLYESESNITKITEINDDMNFYVVRKPKEISVIYNIQGNLDKDININRNAVPTKTEKYSFYDIQITDAIPTVKNDKHYKFAYWIDKNNNKYYSGQTVLSSNNLNLEAYWEEKSYDILIDDKKYKKFHNEDFEIPMNDFLSPREGYVYMGLSQYVNSTKVEFTSIIPASINQNMILYPVYAKEYTITYIEEDNSRIEKAYEFYNKQGVIASIVPIKPLKYNKLNGNERIYFSAWIDNKNNKYYPHLNYDIEIVNFTDNNLTLIADYTTEDNNLNYFYFLVDDNNNIQIQAQNFDEIESSSKMNDVQFFNKDTLQANNLEERKDEDNATYFKFIDSDGNGFYETEISTSGQFIQQNFNQDYNLAWIENANDKLLYFGNKDDINNQYLLKFKRIGG